MKIMKKIAAVLCAVMVSGTVMVAVPAGTAVRQTMTVSAAATANAPKLNKTQLSLGKGESYKLTADQSVKWRTSAPKILTVDQSGNVKAVGTGTAWITAKNSAGKEQSCKITVKNAPSKVSISKTTLTLGVGEEYSLSASVPEGSAAAKRTFRTSNSSIVKMTKTDWTGSFKALKTGTAWVTVRTYNGKEASCKITVKKAPTWVSISKKTMTMTVGQTATLSASIASDAGCAKRTFRTSNSSIVKMTKTDWTGSFKAVKPGTAWVTVRTYNGKESSCKIAVVEKDYWRKLYKKKLNSLDIMNTNLTYEMFDIDKDGVPELFISQGNSYPSTCRMYYLYCGQLRDSGIVSLNSDMNVGDKGYIYYEDGRNNDDKIEVVYQKSGETIKQVIRFDTLYDRSTISYTYKINGKYVSLNEFNRLHDRYYKNISKRFVGDTHRVSDRECEKVVDNYPFVFERFGSLNYDSATITAYNNNGTFRWSYHTKQYILTEQEGRYMKKIYEVGVKGDHYYLVEDGKLICLNKNTGKKLWQVSGVGQSNDHCFDSSGNLYITGYLGPVVSKISPEGRLLWRVNSLESKGYTHPFKIELYGSNKLKVTIHYTNSAAYTTILLDAKTGKLL